MGSGEPMRRAELAVGMRVHLRYRIYRTSRYGVKCGEVNWISQDDNQRVSVKTHAIGNSYRWPGQLWLCDCAERHAKEHEQKGGGDGQR